jgi:S1-C subfamily serine protease
LPGLVIEPIFLLSAGFTFWQNQVKVCSLGKGFVFPDNPGEFMTVNKLAPFTILLFIMSFPLISAEKDGNPVVAPPTKPATTTVQAVEKALPSVVSIGGTLVLRTESSEVPAERPGDGVVSLGSGVIIDAAGLVLTNHHVVRLATNYTVTLHDGNQYPAVLVAADSANDLALLRIRPGTPGIEFTPIEFATPELPPLGDMVVCIGNPLGLGQSISVGVVSAVNRSFTEDGVKYVDLIQTDAAINPGNSGCPLVNQEGAMIGLSVAVQKNANGIGYALSMDRIETVLSSWLLPARFTGGYVGVVCRTLSQDGRLQVGIDRVEAESPALENGLKSGDVITAINGLPVSRAFQISRKLWSLKVGEQVRFSLADGRTVSFLTTAVPPRLYIRQRLGISLLPLSSQVTTALGLPSDLRGLVISEVVPGSEFHRLRARRGDIIIKVGDTDTPSLEAVETFLRKHPPGQRIPVTVLASGKKADEDGAAALRPSNVHITLQ